MIDYSLPLNNAIHSAIDAVEGFFRDAFLTMIANENELNPAENILHELNIHLRMKTVVLPVEDKERIIKKLIERQLKEDRPIWGDIIDKVNQIPERN